MSVKAMEYKGTREMTDVNFLNIGAPAHFKHLQLVSDYMTPNHFYSFVNNDEKTGAFNETGKFVLTTPTPAPDAATEYFLGGGAASTNVTPWIVKGSAKVRFRNNYTKDAVITLYNVKPRTLIPDIIPQAKTTAMGQEAFIPTMVIEGIGDKLSSTAATTSKVVAYHNVQNGARSAVPIHGTTYDSCSYTTHFTIFDSNLFCQFFKVIGVTTVKLKPGDTAEYTWKLPTVDFPDGVEPYIGAETLALEFSRYLLAEVQGDLAHETDLAMASSHFPTNSAAIGAGTKIYNAYVGTSECTIDVSVKMSLKVEIFDRELIEPHHAIRIQAENDVSDMNDAMLQSVHDVN